MKNSTPRFSTVGTGAPWVCNAAITTASSGSGRRARMRAQVTAEPDGIDRYRVLVTAPAAAVSPGGSMIRFNLSDATGASSVATQFDGPES